MMSNDVAAGGLIFYQQDTSLLLESSGHLPTRHKLAAGGLTSFQQDKLVAGGLTIYQQDLLFCGLVTYQQYSILWLNVFTYQQVTGDELALLLK